MKNYLFVLFLLFIIPKVYSQSFNSYLLENNRFPTNISKLLSENNPDTLTIDRNSHFLCGIASLGYKLPSQLALSDFSQTGVIIGSRRNSSNIDEITFDENLNLSFNIGSENTVGFFMNQFINKHPDNTIDTAQHYSGILNLFSYNINSELIVRLPVVDRKIIGGISLTFLNFGATATYFSGGKFDGKYIGALDIVPLYLQFYGKVSFKNATFGIGAFLNPISFVEYRFGSKELLENGTGIFMHSANFKKYALTFYIHFK